MIAPNESVAMVAGARTFTLEDSLLEHQVLEPPPTRHALFISLLLLAAILHLATAGWGDLYNGPEGQFAGGAREMLASQQWLTPTTDGVPRLQTPPLVYWLIILSYKVFGVSESTGQGKCMLPRGSSRPAFGASACRGERIALW